MTESEPKSLNTANLFPPSSAKASDVIFGAALAAALPGHAQRKVPLLLAGCGTIEWD